MEENSCKTCKYGKEIKPSMISCSSIALSFTETGEYAVAHRSFLPYNKKVVFAVGFCCNLFKEKDKEIDDEHHN